MLLGVLDRAAGAQQQRAAGRTAGLGLWPVWGSRVGTQAWWPAMTEESLLTVTAAQACVSLIADQIACAPMYVQHPDGSTSDPPELLCRPDPEQTCVDTLTQLMFSLLTCGNAYALVTTRGAGGMPTSIKVLSHRDVWVDRWHDSYRLRYRVCGEYVPNMDLIHVRGRSLGGDCVGIGPITYGARLMGIAQREADYAALRFDGSGNGAAIPDYFIESDQPITEAQAKQVAKMLQRRAGGLSRGPVVLDHGMKVKRVEMNAEELDLIVSRKFTDTQICSMFGVPAHLVQVQVENSMTYSNVRDDMVGLTALTLKTWSKRLCSGLSAHLLPPRDMLRSDFSELTQDLDMGSVEPMPDPDMDTEIDRRSAALAANMAELQLREAALAQERSDLAAARSELHADRAEIAEKRLVLAEDELITSHNGSR